MIASEIEVVVRYAETDMMGIVYHGSYLPWLEMGRTQLLKERGYPYKELEAKGLFLPVIEINLNYKRPAKYDDTLLVRTIMKDKPFVKIRLEYEILKEDERIATGYSVHAFMNKDGQAIKAPRDFLTAIESGFQEGSATP